MIEKISYYLFSVGELLESKQVSLIIQVS